MHTPKTILLKNLLATRQKFQVGGFFGIRLEQELSGISTLRDVVREISYCNTCQTRHRPKVSGNVPSVPEFPRLPKEG